MKLEIDLDDILGDEYGVETLSESIRRQIIEQVTKTIKDGIGQKIDKEISRVISVEMAKAVTEKMPLLLDDLMSADYVRVDRFGHSSGKTNFRHELIKSINSQMVYQKTAYEGDRNAFTRSVDQVIAENLKLFQKQFNKLIDDTLTSQIMDHAISKVREKFGVKG